LFEALLNFHIPIFWQKEQSFWREDQAFWPEIEDFWRTPPASGRAAGEARREAAGPERDRGKRWTYFCGIATMALYARDSRRAAYARKHHDGLLNRSRGARVAGRFASWLYAAMQWTMWRRGREVFGSWRAVSGQGQRQQVADPARSAANTHTL
jgi:hypothetical protein